jgi:hypothetical protein
LRPQLPLGQAFHLKNRSSVFKGTGIKILTAIPGKGKYFADHTRQ